MEENGGGLQSPVTAAYSRSLFFDPASDDAPQHFLDACFLCKAPIGPDRDIFMYKGDTPFCSEECREEQIEIDEAKEASAAICVAAVPARKAAQGIEISAAGAVLAV